MAKQVKNLLDSLQPAPPSVDDFLNALRGNAQPQSEAGASMFGDVFNDSAVEAIPSGSAGVQGSGVKLAFQFEVVRNQLDPAPMTLDKWFCELARFTLAPNALFEVQAKQQECLTQRRAVCEQHGIRMRSHKVGSFRTYINGLAKVYNGNATTNHFVTSSNSQFPKTNALLAACNVRERVIKAIDEVEAEDVLLLTDADLAKIYDATNFSVPGEAQRYNIIVLSYRTGLRPDNLKRLRPDVVKLGVLADGTRCLTFVIGNMKNLPGTLTSIDLAMFKQQVVEAADPKFCAIQAFERQCKLLETAQPAELSYLFRTWRYWQKRLGSEQTTVNTYSGAANWVKDLLKKDKFTHKDLGRRVAMTKLANDPDISLMDAAKYLGVHVTTLRVYHRSGPSVATKAAEILSRADPSAPIAQEQASPPTEGAGQTVTDDDINDGASSASSDGGPADLNTSWVSADLCASESGASSAFTLTQESERYTYVPTISPDIHPGSPSVTPPPSPPPPPAKKQKVAEPIIPCEGCGKPMPKKSSCQPVVACDKCSRPYHLKCAGLRRRPPYGSWICPECA